MKNRLRTPVRICAVAMAMAMLAGCDNPYVKQLKDEFGWTESRMLQDGWLKTYPIAQPDVYCYHTLAGPDCYSEPKRDQKDRLINATYDGVF